MAAGARVGRGQQVHHVEGRDGRTGRHAEQVVGSGHVATLAARSRPLVMAAMGLTDYGAPLTSRETVGHAGRSRL